MKNNTQKNKLILYLFIIIIILIIIFIIYRISNNVFTPPNDSKKSIEIIIARYNEDLKWTLEPPFNKYKYILYNKGDNEEYEKTNIISTYNIKNEGKCDHTYLYHIYQNYNQLSDIIIFLPGCLNENYFKTVKATLLLNLVDKYQEAFFLVDYKSKIGIFSDLYYFKLDDYSSLSKANSEKNEGIRFRKSKIRPFGKWYQSNFDYEIQNISLFGIFSFNKMDIYNHKQKDYFRYMSSLEGAVNDELSHYYERSWEAIVYPMKYTKVLNYSHNLTIWTWYFYMITLKYNQHKYVKHKSSPFYTYYWNFIYFINRYTPILYKIK